MPAHNGIRDRGLPKPTDDGTTLLVTEGAGNEDRARLSSRSDTNSTLKGVVLYYPEQNADDDAQALSLGDRHARQEPGRPRRRDAQPVQRHRRDAETSAT